jgi:hypothetical protein
MYLFVLHAQFHCPFVGLFALLLLNCLSSLYILVINPRSEQLSSKEQRTTNASKDAEGKGTLIHCWCEQKLIQPLWKSVWWFLKKKKIELPYDLAILLLGIYPKDSVRHTCTPMFIAALFTIAKLWNKPRYPSKDEWVRKCVIYAQWSFTWS